MKFARAVLVLILESASRQRRRASSSFVFSKIAAAALVALFGASLPSVAKNCNDRITLTMSHTTSVVAEDFETSSRNCV